MEDISHKYIITTPCKNEGENLPYLIESIVAQTIRPLLWVIVDDGSTDNTSQITKQAAKNYNWIDVLRLDSGERDLGLHYANILKKGLDYAISYCKDQGLEYSHLGIVDGDIRLPSTFFEKLMSELEVDTEVGVASGGTKHIIGNRVVHAKVNIDEPSGGHMLIKRKCFEECNGISLSYSCDSVLKVKARLRGWKTKRFEENIAIEIRDVSSAENYWKGYTYNGKSAYFRNINPIHVIVKSIIYLLKKPYYIGIAYLIGYFGDFVQNKKQIDDNEVKKYYWNKFKKYL